MTTVPSPAAVAAASRVAPVRTARSSESPDQWALAVDVGCQRLSAGLVSAQGQVIVRDRVTTPRDVWPALQRLVRRVVAARDADREKLLWCGVTCEAPIDAPAGTVAPLTMPAFSGFELRGRIAELTGLDTVLETRGNGRALAEHWRGGHDAIDADHMVVVIASESVDGGVIVDGQVLHGRSGNAGNVAHVIVEPENGLECACGGTGCLSPYVSTRALETELNRPLRRAPAAIVERTGVMLGRAVASAAASFDTRLVLIGGATPAALGPPLLEATRREVQLRSKLSHLSELRVEPATLGLEGPLLGAARSAFSLRRPAPR